MIDLNDKRRNYLPTIAQNHSGPSIENKPGKRLVQILPPVWRHSVQIHAWNVARTGALRMKPDQSRKRPRTRILVIDDDPSIRRALSEILVSEGYEVNTAASAEHICRLVEVLDPDVVLLDLVLPAVNGIEAVSALRAQACTEQVPVVAMTASWLGSQGEKLATVGFQGALRKPFTGSALCGEIRRIEARSNDRPSVPPMEPAAGLDPLSDRSSGFAGSPELSA